MPDSFVYLLLDALTLIGPLALSFDKRVSFYRDWKNLAPALLIVSTCYIIWDVIFTRAEIWIFNPKHLIGASLFDLPLEEWLFFVVVPYACLFIYRCLQVYFPKINFSSFKIFQILGIFSLILAVLSWGKWYTFITFFLLALSIWIIEKSPLAKGIFKIQSTYIALTWLLSAVPMWFVNGKLTSLPVVIYDNNHNLALRLGTIPVEDFFYNLLYILWLVTLYEWFKSKTHYNKPSSLNK